MRIKDIVWEHSYMSWPCEWNSWGDNTSKQFKESNLPMGHNAVLEEIEKDIWSWSIYNGTKVIKEDKGRYSLEETKNNCKEFWENYILNELFER